MTLFRDYIKIILINKQNIYSLAKNIKFSLNIFQEIYLKRTNLSYVNLDKSRKRLRGGGAGVKLFAIHKFEILI
jgi:hypothetical protein